LDGDWGLINDHIHPLNHVVQPAGEAIECEDCHAPDCSFDWIAAGYTTQQADQFIWSDYPTSTLGTYHTQPPWVGILAVALGIAIAINLVTVMALVTRRSG
jgi:hypothetical protein